MGRGRYSTTIHSQKGSCLTKGTPSWRRVSPPLLHEFSGFYLALITVLWLLILRGLALELRLLYFLPLSILTVSLFFSAVLAYRSI